MRQTLTGPIDHQTIFLLVLAWRDAIYGEKKKETNKLRWTFADLTKKVKVATRSSVENKMIVPKNISGRRMIKIKRDGFFS